MKTSDLHLPTAVSPRVREDGMTTGSAVANGSYLFCRYLIERILAVPLIIAGAPLILLIAALVKLTAAGPAFYTQRRVGQGGKIYSIFKIRTMVEESETLTGPVWSGSDDPRVTPIGRFLRSTHLDELPQLLNVMRGEMSLIGPRPERPEFIPEIQSRLPHYCQRLAVRPGLTGLAQVHLLSDLNIESVRRKLGYDLYYIRNVGPWLDARILVGTALYLFAVAAHTAGKLLTQPDRHRIERDLHSQPVADAEETDEWRVALTGNIPYEAQNQ
jgi:lipopolysaccharide/colanic/teichoic acid biosynthesis glycosyltransferase